MGAGLCSRERRYETSNTATNDDKIAFERRINDRRWPARLDRGRSYIRVAHNPL